GPPRGAARARGGEPAGEPAGDALDEGDRAGHDEDRRHEPQRGAAQRMGEEQPNADSLEVLALRETEQQADRGPGQRPVADRGDGPARAGDEVSPSGEGLDQPPEGEAGQAGGDGDEDGASLGLPEEDREGAVHAGRAVPGAEESDAGRDDADCGVEEADRGVADAGKEPSKHPRNPNEASGATVSETDIRPKSDR